MKIAAEWANGQGGLGYMHRARELDKETQIKSEWQV